MSEMIKCRKRGARIRVEHSAPVNHELPVLEPLCVPADGHAVVAGEDFRSSIALSQEALEQAVMLAHRRGYEEGAREGERRCRAAAATVLEQERALEVALADSVREQLDQFVSKIERDALRFALGVAGRILRREVTLDHEVILRQIREALHRVVGAETVTVRVNPADEHILREQKSAVLGSSDGIREIIVEGDATIERGGCIIESASGNIDARLATQLAQVEAALFAKAATARGDG